MSGQIRFNNEELDVLREIANIGMGQAGASLAEALGSFVVLKVPQVHQVTSAQIPVALANLLKKYEHISLVRQPFFSGIQGESVFVYGDDAPDKLSELLGYEGNEAKEASVHREILLEISNTLNNVCINGIAAQMSMEIHMAEPVLVGFNQPTANCYDMLYGTKQVPWQETILINVDFIIEARAFSSKILIFIAEKSLPTVHSTITKLLEG